MGAVYLAHPLARPTDQVAVKILLPAWQLTTLERQHLRQRFLREAHILMRMHHPHILRVLATGEVDDLSYLVMPYVAAGSLEQYLQDHPGIMPDTTIVQILHQLAEAIDYAHAQGIIHRDIKPANILLSDQSGVLLADFGIMREEQGDQTKLTMTGQVIGTPIYIAPEQARGGHVTGAVDRYSLGIVAYVLFAGHPPFTGETPLEIMMKHATLPPPSLLTVRPDLAPGSDAVLQRMLAKDPTQRWPTAMAFVQALAEVLAQNDANLSTLPYSPMPEGFTQLAPPPQAARTLAPLIMPTVVAVPGQSDSPHTKTRPRSPTMLVGMLALVVILVIGSSAAWWYAQQTHQQPSPGTSATSITFIKPPATATATESPPTATATIAPTFSPNAPFFSAQTAFCTPTGSTQLPGFITCRNQATYVTESYAIQLLPFSSNSAAFPSAFAIAIDIVDLPTNGCVAISAVDNHVVGTATAYYTGICATGAWALTSGGVFPGIGESVLTSGSYASATNYQLEFVTNGSLKEVVINGKIVGTVNSNVIAPTNLGVLVYNKNDTASNQSAGIKNITYQPLA